MDEDCKLLIQPDVRVLEVCLRGGGRMTEIDEQFNNQEITNNPLKTNKSHNLLRKKRKKETKNFGSYLGSRVNRGISMNE